jgi:DnaK suppressor protein
MKTFGRIKDIDMKPENLRRIKRHLLRRLNELQFEAIQAVFEKGAMNDNPSDFVDKASREFEQNAEMMMKERKRSLIRDLQGAIMRIDRGVFGICEVCEGRISERRLLAIPTSRFCIVCMEKEGNPKAA